MVRQTRDFLEETCKELLILVDRRLDRPKKYSELDWDVEFLHRTVTDFLYDCRSKLILEQQPADLYDSTSFLDHLNQLRCTHLLSESMMGCRLADKFFHSAIRASQRSSLHDRAWLLRCEALMIERHQKGYKCLGAHHWKMLSHSNVQSCTSVELMEYLLAIITSWPHLVMQCAQDEGFIAFLLGWLEFALKEADTDLPDENWGCGFQEIENIYNPLRSVGAGSLGLQRSILAPLRMPMTPTLECSATKLLQGFLEGGVNPNQQSEHKLTSSGCVASIWQNWLSSVYLRLERHHQATSTHAQPAVSREHFKRKVGEFVVILLQQGADPTGRVCITDHDEHKLCEFESMGRFLRSITSKGSVDRVQATHSYCSLGFSRVRIRYTYLLRAMANWIPAERSGDAVSKSTERSFQENCNLTMFLHSLIGNSAGWVCSACAHWNLGSHFAVAYCLDCDGLYYLCHNCITKQFPDEDPIHNDLSRRLVHKRSFSIVQHTHFFFGCKDNFQPIFYGMESALAVLGDWYARNTTDVNTVLD
jgi:hypothetical protein